MKPLLSYLQAPIVGRVEPFHRLMTRCWMLMRRHDAVLAAALTAMVATLAFFYPALLEKGWHASYTTTGDTWHASLAHFVVARYFVMHGIFSGLDFFTHNGASEYFLRPNFPVYYPLLHLFLPLIKGSDPKSLTHFYVLFLTVHAALSTYFLHRVCARFLKFDYALAAFVAVGYSFSMQIVQGMWFQPLITCAWLLPLCLYAGLAFAERPSLSRLVLASIPAFLAYTAGYFPAAVAVQVFAGLSIVGWSWVSLEPLEPSARLWRAACGVAPALLATCVVLPYYAAAMLFHQHVEIAVSSYTSSLVPVAHELADSAQNILRGVLAAVTFSGPMFEFYVFWGLVPLLIIAFYIYQLPEAEKLAAQEGVQRWNFRLLQACAVLYAFMLLAIMGRDTAFSNIFYYFVPLLSTMHIYQRYMVFAHLFFMLATALMLNDLIQRKPPRRAVKVTLAFMALLVATASQWVGLPVGRSNPIGSAAVAELLFGTLFLVALLMFRRQGIVLTALVLMFAVSLAAGHRYTNDGLAREVKVHERQMALSRPQVISLSGWLKSQSSKPIIKYVDVTPGFHNYISKNMPWLLLEDVKLSGYYGYDPHLGAEVGLRRLMFVTREPSSPDLVMRPDWDWLRKTGAEFVLFEDGHVGNDPKIKDFADMSDGAVYRFQGMNGNAKDENIPANYVLARLKFPPPDGAPVRFDNAYVRVQGEGADTTVSQFATNNGNALVMNVSGTQQATVQYLFWPGRHLRVYLDGQRQEFVVKDGLLTMTVPPGDHRLEIIYRNPLLTIFVVLYALYAALVVAAAGWVGYLNWRRWRPQVVALWGACFALVKGQTMR